MHISESLASQSADSSDFDGGHIAVENVNTDGSVLHCELTAEGQVAQFLTGDPLCVDYNQPIEDVSASLLAVPALSQICPVAWAMGADVYVERVDPDFLIALNRVRQSLGRLYPSLVRGGEIQYEETGSPGICDEPSARNPPTGKNALLFDGGVDSIASFVVRRRTTSTLITLQRWVPESEAEASRVAAQTSSFARRHGCSPAFIQSNVLSVLDISLLNSYFGTHFDGSWYNAVGQGLGVLGLCAPLCSVREIEQLTRAAPRPRQSPEPWGSHPSIDNEIRWSGTACRHDGANMTRQEKIERITQFVREEDPTVTIRDCPVRAGNCNRCEPCYRTIVGLVAAGLDPRDHGYAVTDETFPAIRAAFEAGQWNLTPGDQFTWETIQAAAPEESSVAVPGAADFFAWFADADLSYLTAETASPLSHRIAHAIVNHSSNVVSQSFSPVARRVRRLFP